MIPELKRLNVLARLPTLSPEQRAEREQLRQAYLAQIRAQVSGHLSVMTVIDPNGKNVTPAALRDAQASGNIR
ncbi:DUF896 domain-containing protein [Suttonella ornithocola]|uniref:Uncharacterized protein conserved in bacteria n=1 Tax=Suttonella ornithocola TaxID=279832 RepID=A0A380MN25_9GAMM|nr:DUF896 domain-containing protein [Suttonella ornithocola]SUO94039.1 Uncharacterized protein conserved in bacteria [Suttonella ornithocola]